MASQNAAGLLFKAIAANASFSLVSALVLVFAQRSAPASGSHPSSERDVARAPILPIDIIAIKHLSYSPSTKF